MKDHAVNPIIRDFVRTHPDIDIDRYSDKGGFGELYFGRRKVLGDRVALKFYELDAFGGGHDEPLLMKEITHDNILPIIDAKVIDDDIAFYLTPEISGGDLQNIIDNSILETDKAINIIQSTLKALNELHKEPRNLVHRDLKTYNILVDKNDGRVYLADFGTIKQIPDGSDHVSASKFSFLYRPYEVIVDDEYYKQSDIYQIGIILFQCLGGAFPMKKPEHWLQGRNLVKYNQLNPLDQQVFLRNHLEDLIVRGRFLNLNTLPIYISQRLKTIIRTATNIERLKRYPTCSDFLKALFDYQKTSKNWWVQNEIVHAYDKRANKTYRIVKRNQDLITEVKSAKVDFRKKFANSRMAKHIEFIDGE